MIDIIVEDIKVELMDSMVSDKHVVNAARISFGKWLEEDAILDASDERLIKYLAKHNHWSPFAHNSVSLRCKVPLFLARQLGKHQVGLVWNEVSRRYVTGTISLYVPKLLHVAPDNAKQGCGELVEGSTNTMCTDWITNANGRAFNTYTALLEMGIAPEEARMVLPQNMNVEFVWTGSLAAFARVYKERTGAGAQSVAREFAMLLSEQVSHLAPRSWAALTGGLYV